MYALFFNDYIEDSEEHKDDIKQLYRKVISQGPKVGIFSIYSCSRVSQKVSYINEFYSIKATFNTGNIKDSKKIIGCDRAIYLKPRAGLFTVNNLKLRPFFIYNIDPDIITEKLKKDS